MRNNKIRRESAKLLVKVSKKLLDQQMTDPDHVDKSLWPDEIFEKSKVKCPECGCEYTFEYGGGFMLGVEMKIYVCKDCRAEFDIYPE